MHPHDDPRTRKVRHGGRCTRGTAPEPPPRADLGKRPLTAVIVPSEAICGQAGCRTTGWETCCSLFFLPRAGVWAEPEYRRATIRVRTGSSSHKFAPCTVPRRPAPCPARPTPACPRPRPARPAPRMRPRPTAAAPPPLRPRSGPRIGEGGPLPHPDQAPSPQTGPAPARCTRPLPPEPPRRFGAESGATTHRTRKPPLGKGYSPRIGQAGASPPAS